MRAVPEGDVVLRTALRLRAALVRRVLTVSDFRWPSLATTDLRGREVTEITAVGKRLLIRCDGLTVHSHLRMDGSWHVYRTGEHPQRRLRHIRIILGNEQWSAAGDQLGELDVIPSDREHEFVGHLGPDILDESFDGAAVAATIKAHGQRAIGDLLLDQRVLAGIGTFYLSEGCFVGGINPWRPANEVPDAQPLVERIQAMMRANVVRAIQTTTGNTRNGQREYVHARSGRPCRRCGTTIRVAPLGVGNHERVVFWCPYCQPGVVPTDDGRARRPLGSGSRGSRTHRS
jgi:endonuclease-8